MKIDLTRFIKLKKQKKAANIDEGAYIINDSTDFGKIESYKSARTNIMFSLPKSDKGKIILITSSEPSEGKTTTAINLAYTFSQTGSKVVVLDCDLRKPRVHRYLKIDRSIGVSNVLCGFETLENAIQKDVKGNLDCIPVGEIPLNSAELLMSDEMTSMLEALSEQYDYIFIDTPPVMSVTDAVILAPRCSGTVVVARQEYSSFDMIDKTIAVLKQSGTKILGFMLNTSVKSSKKYWSSYKDKYSYHYLYNYKD